MCRCCRLLKSFAVTLEHYADYYAAYRLLEQVSVVQYQVTINKPKTVLYFYVFTGEYVDMVKAGIIDPVKVIRTALVDAAR